MDFVLTVDGEEPHVAARKRTWAREHGHRSGRLDRRADHLDDDRAFDLDQRPRVPHVVTVVAVRHPIAVEVKPDQVRLGHRVEPPARGVLHEVGAIRRGIHVQHAHGRAAEVFTLARIAVHDREALGARLVTEPEAGRVGVGIAVHVRGDGTHEHVGFARIGAPEGSVVPAVVPGPALVDGVLCAGFEGGADGEHQITVQRIVARAGHVVDALPVVRHEADGRGVTAVARAVVVRVHAVHGRVRLVIVVDDAGGRAVAGVVHVDVSGGVQFPQLRGVARAGSQRVDRITVTVLVAVQIPVHEVLGRSRFVDVSIAVVVHAVAVAVHRLGVDRGVGVVAVLIVGDVTIERLDGINEVERVAEGVPVAVGVPPGRRGDAAVQTGVGGIAAVARGGRVFTAVTGVGVLDRSHVCETREAARQGQKGQKGDELVGHETPVCTVGCSWCARFARVRRL